ncbi:MAG: hypothetical protein ACP5P7_04650 [Sulfurihydrogenibium sp.]
MRRLKIILPTVSLFFVPLVAKGGELESSTYFKTGYFVSKEAEGKDEGLLYGIGGNILYKTDRKIFFGAYLESMVGNLKHKFTNEGSSSFYINGDASVFAGYQVKVNESEISPFVGIGWKEWVLKPDRAANQLWNLWTFQVGLNYKMERESSEIHPILELKLKYPFVAKEKKYYTDEGYDNNVTFDMGKNLGYEVAGGFSYKHFEFKVFYDYQKLNSSDTKIVYKNGNPEEVKNLGLKESLAGINISYSF